MSRLQSNMVSGYKSARSLDTKYAPCGLVAVVGDSSVAVVGAHHRLGYEGILTVKRMQKEY